MRAKIEPDESHVEDSVQSDKQPSIADLLAMPDADAVDFEPPRIDGIFFRAIETWDEPADLKDLFASVTEGLTDEDLSRPHDLGREEGIE